MGDVDFLLLCKGDAGPWLYKADIASALSKDDTDILLRQKDAEIG